MRIVLIGVSHWHTPFYLVPALELPDVTIVGVSDPDLARAQPVADQAGCPTFSDYRDMCADSAAGLRLRAGPPLRHGRGGPLPDRPGKIPFAMEKPCGISSAEVHDIAARAAEAGVYAAVPFVLRYCPLIDTIREMPPARRAIHHLQVCRGHGGPLPPAARRMDAGPRHGGRRAAAQSRGAPSGYLPRAAGQCAVAGDRCRHLQPHRCTSPSKTTPWCCCAAAAPPAWWRPVISTPRRIRCSTCTTASAPTAIISLRAIKRAGDRG